MRPAKRTTLFIALGLLLCIVVIARHRSRNADNPPSPPSNTVASSGEFSVAACSTVNGVAEPCYWRYTYNNQTCTGESKCSKLVILFSGGEMGCDDSYAKSDSVYGRTLKSYADDGYIAICANVFMTEEPGASIPLNEEAERINTIVSDIRASNVINALWDGKHLLFAGISHGASAPVNTMARTNFDDTQNWKGTETTAACFHDGVYDIPAADSFLTESTTPLRCAVLRNRTICERYFGTTNCTAPTLDMPAVALDTITEVGASSFAIKNWKLIECGSALPACALDGDWIPAGPIQQLCSTIDNGPNHTCTFDSLPTESHRACIGTTQGNAKCRDWFDALVKN